MLGAPVVAAQTEPLGPLPDTTLEPPNPSALATQMRRPHGMVEAGIGWLALPGAEICVERVKGSSCPQGDSSLTLEAWQIFRLPPGIGIGGGVMLGLTPTTDTPAKQIEGIDREHSRGYFAADATARYYPYIAEKLEAYAGVSGGLVVVSDTFSTALSADEEKPLVGATGVVIRTEGFGVAVGGGIAYELRRGWTIGSNLRVGAWYLPSHAKVSPLGDEASLVGRNAMFVAGVNLAYRVPL